MKSIELCARLSRRYVGAILLIGGSVSGWAQSRPDYLGLQKSLAALSGTPSAAASPAAFEQVKKGVNELVANLKKADAKSTDDEIAVSHLSHLLQQAKQDPVQSPAILADVATDLQIKNRYYGGHMGVTGQSRGQITVTVNTLRDRKPVPGLLVYCNPYRWAQTTDHAKTFAKLSSPTQALILPGLYRCVASRADGKVAGERPAPIGLDGNDKYDLDIPVVP